MTWSRHPPGAADDPKAFIYSELLGFTCSICAPADWEASQVAKFAKTEMGTEGWQAVDVSTVMPGLGQSPGPCSQAPEKRRHWFLMREP